MDKEYYELKEQVNEIGRGLEKYYELFGTHIKEDQKIASDVKETNEWLRELLYGDESSNKPGVLKRMDRLESSEQRRNVSIGVIWAALIGVGIKLLSSWIEGK